MKICNQCQTENLDELLYCQNCFAELPAAIVAASTSIKTVIEVPQPVTEIDEAPIVPIEKAPISPVEKVPIVPASPPATARRRGQLGSGKRSAADIWGPFAGYGSRGRHNSWMLDGQGDNAKRLRDVVTERFGQRQIPGVQVNRRTLTAKGLIVENRPYYLIQRGITTMGLHIARFGQDLFISQVTYTLGPINPLRVLILALMIIFQLFMIYGYGGSLQSSIGTIDIFGGGYSGNVSTIGILLCCIGPLGAVNTLLLILAGLHAIYKYLLEKNPLALLRRPPNEFEIDDIIALEKSVEETVRQALDAIELDKGKMPPALHYGPREGRIF